jgi:hypothetical protein
MKPREGSYLANWRTWGTGPMGIDDAGIPFSEDQSPAANRWGGEAHEDHERTEGGWFPDLGYRIKARGARTPSNLLSYGDLLGDLQKYADIDAWCEALGLPEEAAELLEAGLVYCPKPSRSEKNRGLPDDYDAKRNPCAKPVALCAYLITLATCEGQTVLDPFCGEAAVGVAATLLGRDFVGIELEEDFCETARARIAHAERTVAEDDTCAEVPRQLALLEEDGPC